ncbi:MAG: Kef family K(+) transporter [Pseudomonadota bacterium]|nr:Kef family K(+) transporter [Pseudomonadota bacterium]
MHHTSLIALLVAGLVTAFVFGALAQRLRLSPLVGYLLAGVAVGPFTPGFVGDATLAPQIAELGVILLMFGVGIHFSFADLMRVRAIAIPGAVAQIAVATVLGWGLARLLGWSHGAGIVFGLALSVASTVVLLRALEERRLVDTARGHIAVGWLIVEDVVMVLALVLLPAFFPGADGPAEQTGDGPLLTVLLTLAKVVAFVVTMLIVGRRAIPWILERVTGTGSRELFTLSVLAIALGVAFGSAELFGVSFALGAFFAGMILSESEFSQKAATETLPLRDAFAVLFFVSVGMLFDPGILLERPLDVVATALIIVVGKSVAAWGIVRAFGNSSDTALLIAASLAQIGEFSFILAGLGLQLQVLPQDGYDLILAGAIVSIMVNPLLFAMVDRQAARSLAAREFSRQDAAAPIPASLSGHPLVIGYGRVGSELARLLKERGASPVVIDADTDRVESAREHGLLAVLGNAVDPRVLAEAGAERAAVAILAVPSMLEAGSIAATLRSLLPSISLLARVHSDGGVQHLLERGADAAVMAERELAHSMAEMVLAMPDFRGGHSLRPG